MKSKTYKVDPEKAVTVRKKQFPSQGALARKTIEIRGKKERISTRTISAIETGADVSSKKVKIYAALCGVDLEEILHEDDDFHRTSGGTVDLRGRVLFGVASKSALSDCEEFYKQSREQSNWYRELSYLEEHLLEEDKKTTLVPCDYRKLIELNSTENEMLYIRDDSESEHLVPPPYPGAKAVQCSIIWTVQDDLVVDEEAIKLLKELKDIIEPKRVPDFSLESLTDGISLRTKGTRVMNQLSEDHQLCFFAGWLGSSYFRAYPKEIVQIALEEWDVDDKICEFSHGGIAVRPIVALGKLECDQVKITYTTRKFDVPW